MGTPSLYTSFGYTANDISITDTSATDGNIVRITFYFNLVFRTANNSGDVSAHGEGETYIGFANVATDGSGNATIHAGQRIQWYLNRNNHHRRSG